MFLKTKRSLAVLTGIAMMISLALAAIFILVPGGRSTVYAAEGGHVEESVTANTVTLRAVADDDAAAGKYFVFRGWKAGGKMVGYQSEIEVDAAEKAGYEAVFEPAEPISTAEQLSAVGADSANFSKNYKLLADISLSSVPAWKPIGTDALPYTGIFDGNGRTISDLTVAAVKSAEMKLGYGIFQVVSGAVVKNLNVRNFNITATGLSEVGTIAGRAAGDAVFLNLSSEADCSVRSVYSEYSGGQYAGGLLGYGSQDSKLTSLVIENCVNRASVQAKSHLGGIAGRIILYLEQVGRISGCENYGQIGDGSTENGGSDALGGIIGSLYGPQTITDCVNYGDILCGPTSFGNYGSSGGIAGVLTGSGRMKISDCFNYGRISGQKKPAGGILGEGSISLDVEDCYNYGSVEIKAVNASYGFTDMSAGGIAGSLKKPSVLSDCFNFGSVGTASAGYFAGGIAGNFVDAGSAMRNCANFGAVSSKTAALAALTANTYASYSSADNFKKIQISDRGNYAGGELNASKTASLFPEIAEIRAGQSAADMNAMRPGSAFDAAAGGGYRNGAHLRLTAAEDLSLTFAQDPGAGLAVRKIPLAFDPAAGAWVGDLAAMAEIPDGLTGRTLSLQKESARYLVTYAEEGKLPAALIVDVMPETFSLQAELRQTGIETPVQSGIEDRFVQVQNVWTDDGASYRITWPLDGSAAVSAYFKGARLDIVTEGANQYCDIPDIGAGGMFYLQAKKAGFGDKIIEIEFVLDNVLPAGWGTAENPAQINTVNQLYALTYNPDKNFVLARDIDLAGGEFGSIGMTETQNIPFRGKLDGQNHVLSHFVLKSGDGNSVGLFRDVEGTVENLILDNFSHAAATGYTKAFLANRCYGGVYRNIVIRNSQVTADNQSAALFSSTRNSVIDNILIENVTLHTGNFSGIAVGTVEPGTQIGNLTIRNSSLFSVGSSGVGGAFGVINGGDISNVLIENIGIEATAILDFGGGVPTDTSIGGLAGMLKPSYTSSLWSIADVVVRNVEINKVSQPNAGGLIGLVYQMMVPGTISNVLIQNVAVSSEDSYAGGLIGSFSVGSSYNEPTDGSVKLTLDRISCYATVAASDYAGGLIGGMARSSHGNLAITNSFNAGTVVSGGNAAGFVNLISGTAVEVSASYNSGFVMGTKTAATVNNLANLSGANCVFESVYYLPYAGMRDDNAQSINMNFHVLEIAEGGTPDDAIEYNPLTGIDKDGIALPGKGYPDVWTESAGSPWPYLAGREPPVRNQLAYDDSAPGHVETVFDSAVLHEITNFGNEGKDYVLTLTNLPAEATALCYQIDSTGFTRSVVTGGSIPYNSASNGLIFVAVLSGDGSVWNSVIVKTTSLGTVRTVAELAAVKDNLTNNFKLDFSAAADDGTVANVFWESGNIVVDMAGVEWIPLGSASASFAGVLDGGIYDADGNLTGRHIFRNLLISGGSYVGFIGKMEGAALKNIDFENASVTATGSFAGVAAGYARGGSVSGVNVRNSTVDGKSSTGGLVGSTYNYTLIDRCTVSGRVTGTGSVGGIAGGQATTYSAVTINNSVTYAEVSGAGTCIGGVVGAGNFRLNNTFMAGTVYIAEGYEHSNNYPYWGAINGYGAWNYCDVTQSGIRLTVNYRSAQDVSSVTVFNSEGAPEGLAVTLPDARAGTFTSDLLLSHLTATTSSLSETMMNGVTGNYGGLVIRFVMADGTYKYVDTLDRAGAKMYSELTVDLDELTSYSDNFASLAIDQTLGSSPYHTEVVGGREVSVFGAVTVDNANDFEHLSWIVNGSIPVTVGGRYYNARSVATLSVKLAADIDLTAERRLGERVLNNGKSGNRLHQFYGFGMSEMHPYRGSVYGEGHVLKVHMDFPKAYLLGIVSMSSENTGTVVIRDLTVRGLIRGNYRVGIVGEFDAYYRSGALRFENVVSDVQIEAVGGGAGGLAGVLHALQRGMTVSSCTVSGSVTSPRDAGAFVGGVGRWGSGGTGSLLLFAGQNRDYTLMDYAGIATGQITIENAASVSRTVKIFYGAGESEYAEISTSDASAVSVTVSSITVGNTTYEIPETVFTFQSGGQTIREFRILLITGAISKTYDGTPDFTLGASNVVGNNLLSGTIAASGADVGSYVSGFSPAGLQADGNPLILFTKGFGASVRSVNLEVTFTGIEGMVYRAENRTPGYSSNVVAGETGIFEVAYYLAGDLSTPVTPRDAGTYRAVVTLTQAGKVNYSLNDTYADFTIAPYGLTADAPEALSKVYGSADPVWTAVTLDGLAGERVEVSFRRDTGEDAGSYALRPVSEDSNYAVTLAVAKVFTIEQAQPGIVLDDLTAAYDGNAKTLSPVLSGVSGMPGPTGETACLYYTDAGCHTLTTTADGAAAAGGAPKFAGVYYVKATVAASGNYSEGVSETAVLRIDPARPVYTARPSAAGIFVGQTLSDSAISGAANVPGSFSWEDGSVAPAVSGSYNVIFAPSDSRNYAALTTAVTVTVTQLHVNFTDDGGTTSFDVNYGSDFPLSQFPVPASRRGHTVAWDTASGLTNVTAEVTVRAVYTPETYAISLALGEGTAGTGTPASHTFGTDTPVPNPSRRGYEFLGWTVNGGTDRVKDLVLGGTAFTGEITLVANWKIRQFTLTYAVESEGSVSADLAGFHSGDSLDYGSTLTLTAAAGEGYRFVGWYAGGAQISADPVLTVTISDEDAVYTAKFGPADDTRYTVEHHYETLAGDFAVERETLYGTTTALVRAAPVPRTGFSHDGSAAGGIPSGNILADGSLVLKLYYFRNQYSVTLNRADGSAPETLLEKYGSVLQLTPPAREGYTFLRWKIAKAEDGSDLGACTDSLTVGTENLTLTAQYQLQDIALSMEGTAETVYGTDVVLTARVSHTLLAEGSVTYQWLRKNASGAFETVPGQTSQTLTLRNVADSGEYRVSVRFAHRFGEESEQSVSGTADRTIVISPADMDVRATSCRVAYDGEPHTISLTAPAGAAVEYRLEGGAWGTTPPAVTDAGPAVYVYYRVSMVNYRTAEGNASVTVTPRELAVRLNDASSVYGEALAELTWTVTSGSVLPGDELNILPVKAEGSDAKSYAITATWSNSNYEIRFAEGLYTIVPAELRVTVGDQSHVYDRTDAFDEAGFTVEGNLSEAERAAFGFRLSLSGPGVNAGRYEVTLVYTANPNFEVKPLYTEAGHSVYLVSPRKITVRIHDQSGGEYDGESHTILNNSEQWSAEGVLAGDALEVTLYTDAESYLDAGTYPIRGRNGNGNYEAAFEEGVFTLLPRKITVRIDDRSSVYGSDPAELTGSVVSGSVVGQARPYALAVRDEGGAAVTLGRETGAGDYRIVGTGADGNYSVTFASAAEGRTFGVYRVERRAVSIADVGIEGGIPGDNGNFSLRIRYDGEAHGVRALNLPEGVTVRYRIGRADGAPFDPVSAIGNYTVYAVFAADANHRITDVQPYKVVSLKIYAMEIEIVWHCRDSYVYDGTDLSGSVWATFVDENGETVRLDAANGKLSFGEEILFRDAGSYTARLTIDDKYIVQAGSRVERNFEIERAVVDMSGVAFPDLAVDFTNAPQTIAVQGRLPEGVSVAYLYAEDESPFAGETEAGEYRVIARFVLADSRNYMEIPDMTATLTIRSIAEAELAFEASVSEIGEVTLASFTAIRSALEEYAALSYTGNVEAARAELDQKITAYNELVRLENARLEEGETLAERAVSPAAEALALLGGALGALALGAALKFLAGWRR